MSCFAQVPCKDVILHARASSSKEPAVKRLAQIPISHSENGAHKVFKEAGCALDIPLSYVDLSTQKAMPYITMTSWVQFLNKTNRLHYLTGLKNALERQRVCYEFWQRVKVLRPDHPVFTLAAAGRVRLEDVVPLLHHGDEGRSYRKTPIMIISTHGLLGRGSHTAERPKHKVAVEDDCMGLNFLGSTVTTHFIFAAMPHALYKWAPDALETMLTLYAKDLRKLALNGIEVTENNELRRLHFFCYGAKGDLPYLGKAGQFTRTYSMCPKSSSSKKCCQGICFICNAGVEQQPNKPDHPWEDFRASASWLGTVGLNPGFNQHAPLLKVPHDHSVLFYRLDIWHCWHLGVGKAFIASALVVLLDAIADEGDSLETRLSNMFASYSAHCKRLKVYGYLASFTRDFLGWDKANNMPAGHWSKGFVTTRLFVWLQEYLEDHFKDTRDPMIQEIEFVPRHQLFMALT
ncbi:unnamed protein product [Symbiodinium sp. CCMP2592]|nr:unnamed protein product [Symbiodinium sp. CCMP2592]